MRPKLIKRRHYRKIFTITASAALPCIALLAVALFLSSRSILASVSDDDNSTLLQQAVSNISAIDAAAYGSLGALYMNADVDRIKYMRREDVFTMLVAVSRLRRSIMAETAGIEGISVYNRSLDRIYNLYGDVFAEDPALRAYIEDAPSAPSRRPFFRSEANGQAVVTYAAMEGGPGLGSVGAAVFLSVRASVLLDCVRELQIDNSIGLRQLFVIDANGSIVDDGTVSNMALAKWASLLDLGEADEARRDGKLYHIAKTALADSGMAVLLIRSADFINRPVSAMAYATLLALIFAFLLAAALTIGGSKNLYRPLEQLLQRLPPDRALDRAPLDGMSDEFAYLNRGITLLEDRARQSGLRSSAYRVLAKERLLYKLLHEPPPSASAEWLEQLPEYGISLRFRQPALVCVFRAGRQMPGALSREDVSILYSALANVSRELLADQADCETLEFGDRLEMIVERRERAPGGEDSRMAGDGEYEGLADDGGAATLLSGGGEEPERDAGSSMPERATGSAAPKRAARDGAGQEWAAGNGEDWR
ncbi:MAG: hypothetical protein LBJ10_07435, partial [Clostridiales bacterium]|nr:hypothetical protein [Clostridiales bacterium]